MPQYSLFYFAIIIFKYYNIKQFNEMKSMKNISYRMKHLKEKDENHLLVQSNYSHNVNTQFYITPRENICI